MINLSLLEDEYFWKTLVFLDSLSKSTKRRDVLKELGITEKLMDQVLFFLNGLNYKVNQENREGEIFLIPPLKKHRVKLDLKFSEWLALQAHFPMMSSLVGVPYHRTITQKLGEVESKYSQYDIFKSQVGFDVHKNEKVLKHHDISSEILRSLEQCILKKIVSQISFSDGRELEIFPHKIFHMDSSLSVVGEDTRDHCLVNFSLATIESIESSVFEEYHQVYSNLEVDEFIMGLRSIQSSDIRLVLKIKSRGEHIDLTPPYHFLGNPYVTVNSRGDRIWAATVGPCPELIEWIANLGDKVQILDPTEFKGEVEQYYNLHLKKSA